MIGDTFNLIEQNFLVILQSFALIILVNLLFFGLNHFYFNDVSQAIFDHNFRSNLSSFSYLKIGFYLFVLAILYLIKFCIILAPIKAFEDNIGVIAANKKIIKKIFPIAASLSLAAFISIMIFFEILAFGTTIYINSASQFSSLIAQLQLSFLINPFVKIISYLAIITLGIYYLVLLVAAQFICFVNIIDEKYYLPSLATSFSCTKNKIFSISFKTLILSLVCTPFFFSFASIAEFLVNLFPEITAFEKDVMRSSIVYFLTYNLSLTTLYLIYKFITFELPETNSFSSKHRIFLLINLVITGAILIALYKILLPYSGLIIRMLNFLF